MENTPKQKNPPTFKESEGSPREVRTNKYNSESYKVKRETLENAEIKAMLDAIPAAAADSFEDWTRLGMAVHAASGGTALSLWESHSAQSAKYKSGECAAKWKTFKTGGGIGAGTLVQMAKDHGYMPPARTPGTPATRWQAARPCTDHPYLQKKQVKHYGLLRVDANGNLLIPMTDRNGDLQSLQTVFLDGQKRFAKGCPVKGLYMSIPGDARRVYLCEGYATAGTIREATGGSAIVCFSAGNLLEVAKTAPDVWPDAAFTICGDNDRGTAGNPGRTKAEAAARLRGCKVAMPDFKDNELGSDWNDFETLHGTDATAKAISKAYTPGDARERTSAENGRFGGREACTKQLADDFADTCRDDSGRLLIRHRAAAGWLAYGDGRTWRACTETHITGLIMGFLRKYAPNHATQNMTAQIMANLRSFDLAGTSDFLPWPVWLDTLGDASGWLSMANCLFNIETGETMPHTPDCFSTWALPYEFDPAAKCPRWLEYLAGAQPDPEARSFMQKMFGLCLVPDCSYEVFFVLFGEAGCGKTVALHILEKLVGSGNCCVLPPSRFHEKFSLHLLTENLVNICGDLPTRDEGSSYSAVEGILKDSVSGGILPVEHKFQTPGEANATARHVFATNSLPGFADRSGGIWQRLRVLPFEVRFRGTTECNPNLKYDLESELPGILNWAREGLEALRQLRQFPTTPAGDALAAAHRLACDHEREFLEEHYEAAPGNFVEVARTYAKYREFCHSNGYKPKSAGNFGESVKRVFAGSYKDRPRQTDGTRPQIYANIKEMAFYAQI